MHIFKIKFYEQELVDCCALNEGDSSEVVHKPYICDKKGVSSADDYLYTAVDDNCKVDSKTKVFIAKGSSIVLINNSTDYIKNIENTVYCR